MFILRWPWRLDLKFKASLKLMFRYCTKCSTNSLFSIIASDFEYFYTIKKNFHLKSSRCSFSARPISGVSWQSHLSWSIKLCSSVVISRYSDLRQLIKLSQSSLSYFSKLGHCLFISGLTYSISHLSFCYSLVISIAASICSMNLIYVIRFLDQPFHLGIRLSRECLILLLIWVDKENIIESLFNFYILLIQLLHGLCTIFPCSSCDSICVTLPCDMWHVTLSCTSSLCNKSKKKKKRKEI